MLLEKSASVLQIHEHSMAATKQQSAALGSDEPPRWTHAQISMQTASCDVTAI